MPDKCILDTYTEIELLIKSAHANLRSGNIKQTACEYDKAIEMLEDFENCVKDKIDLTSSCKTTTVAATGCTTTSSSCT